MRSEPPRSLRLEPIGEVRTARTDHDLTPVQAMLNPDEEGEIQLLPEYEAATHGLEGFSHLWLITWLGLPDQATGRAVDVLQVPFLLRPGGEPKGVFAMRGPRRPNPIGLHLVAIRSVTSPPPTIRFSGVDMIDGTIVLDIKPWVSRFDQLPNDDVRSGWYDEVPIEATTPAELAGRTTDKEKT